MSLSSQFVAKYGKPTTDKTTAGKIKPTARGASGNFLNAVKTNSIKPVPVQAAPPQPIADPNLFSKVKTTVSNVAKKANQFLNGTPATVKTVEPYRQPIDINQPPTLDVDGFLNASKNQLQKVTTREQQIKAEVREIVVKNQTKSKNSLVGKLLPGYGESSPELIENLTNQIIFMGAGKANTLLKQIKNKEDRKKVETLIYENSNNKKAKQLYEQLASGRYKEERGFADGIKEGFFEAGMDVPYGKEIANLVDSASGFSEVQILWEAAQKQKNGQQLTDLEKSYVNKQTSKAVMDALSEKSFGYVVGYGLAQMPKFGLEMYLTSGMSAAPNAALKAKPFFQVLATKAPLIEKITRGLISSVPQTLGFTPQIISNAQQMTLGDPEVILVDGEPMLKYLEEKDGKKFSEAVIERLPKQTLLQYIEVAGERFGEVLDYAGESLIKKLLWKKGVDLAGDIKPSAWQKVLDKMGISSLLSEYAEEVLQGATGEVVETGKFTIPFSTPEDTLQQIATLLTVGIYGTILRVPNLGSRARTKAVQDMMDKLGTDVDLTEEEKEAIGTKVAPEIKTLGQIDAEEAVTPTQITEEQTKASTPAEEKLITRIQTQIESGNDTFVANLRERVAENPKLTKDLEAAVAKAEARIAALEQKTEVTEEKAQKIEKEEIIKGTELNQSIPKDVKKVIESQDYVLRDVNVEEILANDPDAKDFVDNSIKNGLQYRKFTKPIIIGNWQNKSDSVIDGWHRLAMAVKNGDTTIKAFVANKPKIQPKVAEKKKVTSPKSTKVTPTREITAKSLIESKNKREIQNKLQKIFGTYEYLDNLEKTDFNNKLLDITDEYMADIEHAANERDYEETNRLLNKAKLELSKLKVTSPKAVEQTKKKPVVLEEPVKQAQTKTKALFIDKLSKLNDEVVNVDENEVDDAKVDRIEKEVNAIGKKLGFQVEFDDMWGGYVVSLINKKENIKAAGKKLFELTKSFGIDIKLNKDGTIRLYHGTDEKGSALILKNGIDGGIYLSPSTEVEVGGVNGAAFYGDTILSLDADPRLLSFNPAGEFTSDGGIKNIKIISTPEVKAKPKYTEEQVARAEVAERTRQAFTPTELKNIAILKKLRNLRTFAEGDIETLRKVRPDEVSDVVEAVRRIENNPGLSDDAALYIALGIPNAAQTKPSYYTANKAGIYQAINQKEVGIRRLSNEDALKIVREYFTDQEVGVQFVKNLRMPDGGYAWGYSAGKMISFINNPKENTPTHEVGHAFLSLFTSPYQKELYIARRRNELIKKDKAAFNEGVRETQANYSGDRGTISMATAEHIYVEDQIVDVFYQYVLNRRTKTVLARFFDKVIRFARSVIDPNNINNLYYDIVTKNRENARKENVAEQSYFMEMLNKFETTTKTLQNIKREVKQDTMPKSHLEAFTKRTGVSAQDIKVITETLAEMPGDKVNIAELITRVQAKILPLSLIRSYATRVDGGYSDYGVDQLVDLTNPENYSEGNKSFRNENIHETQLWNTPFLHGVAGHFRNVFSSTKVEFEIAERTNPEDGKKHFIVVQKGVTPTEENIAEIVGYDGETRKSAEKWIEEYKEAIKGKNYSGLFASTRTSTSKTKKIVAETLNRKIEEYEKEKEKKLAVIKAKKDLVKFIRKNKKEIVDRANVMIKKMTSGMTDESRSWLKGTNLMKVATRYEELNNRPNYDYDKLVEVTTEKLLRGMNAPIEYFFRYNNEGQVLRYELVRNIWINNKLTTNQKDLVKYVVADNLIGQDQRNIDSLDEAIADVKGQLHIINNASQENEIIRHLLEIQSDPIQGGNFELSTEYTKVIDNIRIAKKEIAELEKSVAETIKDQDETGLSEGEKFALVNYQANTVEKLNAKRSELAEQEKLMPEIIAQTKPEELKYWEAARSWYSRVLKESVRQSAFDLLDGEVTKVKYRVPTAVTLSFIEGHIRGSDWTIKNGSLKKRGSEPVYEIEQWGEREKRKLSFPSKPFDMEDGELAIQVPEPLNYDDGVLIDGDLYRVISKVEGGNVVILEDLENSDYHENTFDDISSAEDMGDLDIGDTITYNGNDYILLSMDGNYLEIAPTDKVKEINLDDEIENSVQSRMDEVSYEIKSFTEKYGKVDTAAQAQKVLDEEGEDSFDNYETGMVLKEMAEADPDLTDLDPYEFMDSARESAYESESEYMGDSSYWEDMGYSKPYYQDGDGSRFWVVEEDGIDMIETVDSPDSEYNVFVKLNLDGDEYDEASKAALRFKGISNADYDKAVIEYDKAVDKINAEVEKKIKELETVKDKPEINPDGTYIFDPDVMGTIDDKGKPSTKNRAVHEFYKNKVVPEFRKMYPQSKLVTDRRGFQWWEIELTEAEKAPVAVYQRKTSAETLLELADQITKSQKIVTGKTTAAKKPVDIEGLKKKSKAYSRIVNQLDDLFRQEVSYDQMTIAKDAANALEFVTQHPDRALRIAKGLELPPQDITETAISIAMADKARESGDYGQWSELERLRSLRQTRRGQEIVSERGRVTENSPEYFLDKVLQERKSIIMAKKGWVYEKKSGKKGVTISEGIKQEVETAKAKVNNRIMNNLESAQDILNRLTCKY